MSNVFKNGFVQINKPNNTRVIDGNALAAMHIEKHSSDFRALAESAATVELRAFDEESEVDALTAPVEEDGFAALTAPVVASDDPDMTLNADDVRAECDEMIKQANDLAEQAREAARADAVAIRENAKQEGYEAGLQQAYEECNNALEEAKRQMEQELSEIRAQYEMCIKQAEPQMVAIISSVYGKVFGEGLCDVRQVLSYLINKTLLKLEGDDRVFIFLNPDDYDALEPGKDELFKRISLTNIPELKPREDLTAGQARIETSYGILDCGIDTQFLELERTLRLISMEE